MTHEEDITYYAVGSDDLGDYPKGTTLEVVILHNLWKLRLRAPDGTSIIDQTSWCDDEEQEFLLLGRFLVRIAIHHGESLGSYLDVIGEPVLLTPLKQRKD